MDYYEKYLKYKTKYLKLKKININQRGGNDDVILYNNDLVNLSRKIKDSKKDIFIDIILWILQDSKYNKNTKKNVNGFNFLTNSANLVFNKNMDGFYFINSVRASKDEIFELTFIIKNIIELQVTENFKVSDLNFHEKNNIYERIEFIKKYFITLDNYNLESISEQKQFPIKTKPIETTQERSPIETTQERSPIEITQERSPIETNPVKTQSEKPILQSIIPNFEPETFYPSDYNIGLYEPIHYKKDKDKFSSESIESSSESIESSSTDI